MSKHLDTIDQLNRAKWLFQAAAMAARALEDETESAALDRLLFEAIEVLQQGIGMMRGDRHD